MYTYILFQVHCKISMTSLEQISVFYFERLKCFKQNQKNAVWKEKELSSIPPESHPI